MQRGGHGNVRERKSQATVTGTMIQRYGEKEGVYEAHFFESEAF